MRAKIIAAAFSAVQLLVVTPSLLADESPKEWFIDAGPGFFSYPNNLTLTGNAGGVGSPQLCADFGLRFRIDETNLRFGPALSLAIDQNASRGLFITEEQLSLSLRWSLTPSP